MEKILIVVLPNLLIIYNVITGSLYFIKHASYASVNTDLNNMFVIKKLSKYKQQYITIKYKIKTLYYSQ